MFLFPKNGKNTELFYEREENGNEVRELFYEGLITNSE